MLVIVMGAANEQRESSEVLFFIRSLGSFFRSSAREVREICNKTNAEKKNLAQYKQIMQMSHLIIYPPLMFPV